MPQPVLATKLFIPVTKSVLVPRPRLVKKIEQGLHNGSRLTLISAPAGYGKSTLAIEWVHWHLETNTTGPSPAICWLSLDEGDNEPERFWLYFIKALQSIKAGLGQSILISLEQPSRPSGDEILTLLINEIARAETVIFVLDDYHVIRALPILQWVDALIEKQPPNLQLILTTRSDPLLRLSRLRARGQLTEIRSDDLRFTPEEALDFFRRTLGLDLGEKDVAILEEQTEGWIAGLQLAGLSLARETNPTEWLRSFNGEERYVMDYLIEEVLHSQTDTIRTFLLNTSILERMCSALCETVNDSQAGTQSSQAILEYLERANLFLIPLDSHRLWYRYHHLFADLLRHSLHQRSSSQAVNLHKRASRWFEENNLLQEAVKHAFQSGDCDYAANLIERHAMGLITHSQVGTLHNWCAAFPEKYIRSHPAICIYLAWTLMLTFRSDFRTAVSERLEQAMAALDEPEVPKEVAIGFNGISVPTRDWVTGQVCAIRSQLLLAAFRAHVDSDELIALSLKSLQLLPEADKPIRSICTINLAFAHLMQVNINEANEALIRSLQLALEAGNYYTAVTVFFYRARIAYFQGRLHEALAICDEGLAKFVPAFTNPEQEMPAIRSIYVVQGLVRLELNELAEAERLLTAASSEVGWAPWVELVGYAALVRLYEIMGKEEKARETLAKMARIGPQHAYCAEGLSLLHDLLIRPDQHVRAAAEDWASSHVPEYDGKIIIPGIGPFHVDTEYLAGKTWAKIQLALNHPTEALKFILPVLDASREKKLNLRIIEFSLLKSLAVNASGDKKQAWELLHEAIGLAESEGCVRIFDQKLGLPGLLGEIAHHPGAGPFENQLFSLLLNKQVSIEKGQTQHPTFTHGGLGKSEKLVESLSRRETEVLNLLATGLSIAEVSQKLFLSPNTLKKHTLTIYGKLGVHSRLQAVNKARELGLLPSPGDVAK